ncbi:hypothetical protein EDB83DRAFT_2554764 [Lactarius deliciosus]|nr:hypothetical protein EDB83DRAFT_2554764 [Lactarius deliciosus]
MHRELEWPAADMFRIFRWCDIADLLVRYRPISYQEKRCRRVGTVRSTSSTVAPTVLSLTPAALLPHYHCHWKS